MQDFVPAEHSRLYNTTEIRLRVPKRSGIELGGGCGPVAGLAVHVSAHGRHCSLRLEAGDEIHQSWVRLIDDYARASVSPCRQTPNHSLSTIRLRASSAHHVCTLTRSDDVLRGVRKYNHSLMLFITAASGVADGSLAPCRWLIEDCLLVI